VLCCSISPLAVAVAHAQAPASPSASAAAAPPSVPAAPPAASAAAVAPTAGSFQEVVRGVPLLSPKRPVPDYDGRGARETSPGESLLWVPRVLFFPVYLVAEYVLRWPLGELTVAAEHGRWIERVSSVFRSGPDGTSEAKPDNRMTAFPTLLVDVGFRTSVGVYFAWDGAGPKGNDFRAHAAIGGSDWFRLALAYNIQVDPTTKLKLRAEGLRRPDSVFYGLGPSSREATRSRFAVDALAAGLALESRPVPGVTALATTSVRNIEFPRGLCCDEPTLRERVTSGALPSVPGFPAGFTTVRQALDVAFDSRAPGPAPGSGVRLELHGDLAFDAQRATTSRWTGYGASVAGYLDLTGKNRVLSLEVSARFADPLGDAAIPFLELPTLGGDGAMRGFVPGRLYGRSQAVAKLEYRYPVWAFLDATLQAAVGNVFGEHLEDLGPELLRTSVAFGFRTNGPRDQSFDILVGAGTETFEQGARFNTVRFVVGSSMGL